MSATSGNTASSAPSQASTRQPSHGSPLAWSGTCRAGRSVCSRTGSTRAISKSQTCTEAATQTSLIASGRSPLLNGSWAQFKGAMSSGTRLRSSATPSRQIQLGVSGGSPGLWRRWRRATIVFLDPDKGLAPPSASQSSPQHCLPERGGALCRAWTDGHHLPPPRPNLGGWRGIAPRTDAVLGRANSSLPFDSTDRPRSCGSAVEPREPISFCPPAITSATIEKRLADFRTSLWVRRKHFTPLPGE